MPINSNLEELKTCENEAEEYLGKSPLTLKSKSKENREKGSRVLDDYLISFASSPYLYIERENQGMRNLRDELVRRKDKGYTFIEKD